MDPEDLAPLKKAAAPRNLEVMGVEELRAYIAGLEAEIARARAVIAAKEGHRSSAESLFRR